MIFASSKVLVDALREKYHRPVPAADLLMSDPYKELIASFAVAIQSSFGLPKSKSSSTSRSAPRACSVCTASEKASLRASSIAPSAGSPFSAGHSRSWRRAWSAKALANTSASLVVARREPAPAYDRARCAREPGTGQSWRRSRLPALPRATVFRIGRSTTAHRTDERPASWHQ